MQHKVKAVSVLAASRTEHMSSFSLAWWSLNGSIPRGHTGLHSWGPQQGSEVSSTYLTEGLPTTQPLGTLFSPGPRIPGRWWGWGSCNIHLPQSPVVSDDHPWWQLGVGPPHHPSRCVAQPARAKQGRLLRPLPSHMPPAPTPTTLTQVKGEPHALNYEVSQSPKFSGF